MKQPTSKLIRRRSFLSRAATSMGVLALGTASATGIVGAQRHRDPSIELTGQGMTSPAGTAVVTRATLPEGGYIVIFDGDVADNPMFDPMGYVGVANQVVGANPNSLGKGNFKRMMIAVDGEELGVENEPEQTLTAQIFKENGIKSWDPENPETLVPILTSPYAVNHSVEEVDFGV